ncbi:MAG: Ig-like domain-containing protein, partial [Patescibacteria group bacterium]
SEDGTKILIAKNSNDNVAGDTGYIYQSTDSGATWTQVASGRYWTSVSATQDLSYIILTAENRYDPVSNTGIDGGIFQINESGGVIQKVGGTFNASAMASNGHAIFVGSNNGADNNIYYSTTFGGDVYSAGSHSGYYTAVALREDGTVAYVTDRYGFALKSTDGGANWNPLVGLSPNSTGIATDDTGSVVYAVSSGYPRIYKSTDGGASWNYLDGAGTSYFNSVSTNSDGSALLVANDNDHVVYSSVDGGVTFMSEGAAGSSSWQSVYLSKSGLRAMVSSSNSYVYSGLLPRVGRYFNGAVSDDISDLGNWWTDSSFTIPANTLPGSTDTVDIYSTVGSNNGPNVPPTFGTINVHGTSAVNVSLTATQSGGINMYDSSIIYASNMVAPVVNFYDTSSLDVNATVGGDTNFYDSSTLLGYSSGPATFFGDDSEAVGTPHANAYIRVYNSSITTGRNFLGVGAAWTVKAVGSGTIVTIADRHQYDDNTVFTTEGDATFVYPSPPVPDAPDVPDLIDSSDTGISDTDNITNNQNPTFTISGLNCDELVGVKIYEGDTILGNTSVCDGDGTATVTYAIGGSFSDGPHDIYAVATNATGDSDPSESITVTVDTTPPGYEPILPEDHTTITNTDDAVQYTLDDDIASGSLTMTRISGIADSQSPHVCNFIGNALLSGAHTINLTDTTNSCETDASSLITGTAYDFYFEWTDPAGNQATYDETAYFDNTDYNPPTIDFVSPTEGTVIHGTSRSLQVNTSDNSGVAGVTYYYDNLHQIGSEITSGGFINEFNTTLLGDGAHTLTAVARDTSDNFATTTINISVDNTPPATPGAPDLEESSDTGSSGTDNITNDTTPTFIITCTEGLSVSLYEDAGLLTSTMCPTGESQVELSYTFSDGNHNMFATLSDEVGNESAPSTGLTFNIDTTPPSISSINSLVGSGSYGVGSVIPIQVNFSENVTISDPLTLGLTTGGMNGTCPLTLTNSTTATCEYTIQAGDTTNALTVSSISGTITDFAGNEVSDGSIGISSNISDTNTIVLDTTAPSAPSSLSADVTDSDVALSWTNPADSDFASVAIVRSTTGYPTSVSDGISIVTGLSDTTYTDTSLSTGTYYYSIFAQDTTGNYSTAAHVSTTVVSNDTTPPHLTLTSSSNSTVNSIFSVTLSADEGIIGFSLTDISLTNATASNLVTLSSSSYTFDVTPLTNGPLSLFIDNGTVTDTTGNPNDPSNTLSRTVLFEADEPTAQTTTGSRGTVTNPVSITPSTITHTPVVNPLPPTFFFTHVLTITNVNSEVKNLQIFLNANGYTVTTVGNGSPGHEINTFGPATRAAVAKFQKDHNILPSVGYFGPITKAYMNAMLKGGIR